jgi:thioredoxin reductase (NADPH)
MTVDILIVGAGPCGLAVAVEAKRRGWSHLVLERGSVADSITRYPTYATFFSTPDKLAVAGIPFPLATEKPTRREALAYYRGVVTHAALKVCQDERVVGIVRDRDAFVVTSQQRAGGPRETRANVVVIATGYFGSPRRLGVPGEELPLVSHWYHEGHEGFQRRVVVVGGGNSAAEASLDLYRHGAVVTMVHFGPTFDRAIKPWLLPDLDARLREGAIDVRWNARVAAIHPDSVELVVGGVPVSLAADRVFLLTGYVASSELLDQLGVHVDTENGVPDHNPETMETPVRGVFVAGVLASGFDANRIFIENGRDHGERICHALAARWATDSA